MCSPHPIQPSPIQSNPTQYSVSHPSVSRCVVCRVQSAIPCYLEPPKLSVSISSESLQCAYATACSVSMSMSMSVFVFVVARVSAQSIPQVFNAARCMLYAHRPLAPRPSPPTAPRLPEPRLLPDHGYAGDDVRGRKRGDAGLTTDLHIHTHAAATVESGLQPRATTSTSRTWTCPVGLALIGRSRSGRSTAAFELQARSFCFRFCCDFEPVSACGFEQVRT